MSKRNKKKNQKLDLNKKFFRTSHTAEYLTSTEGAIRNLVLRRKIPFRKAAGRLFFIKDEIEKWIEEAPGVRLQELR